MYKKHTAPNKQLNIVLFEFKANPYKELVIIIWDSVSTNIQKYN